MDVEERMIAYAAELRRQGAIRTDAVERAFAAVPRHRFLSSGGFYYRGQQHVLGDPPADELMDLIYANNPLFTHKGRDGDPTSSSPQPELMAAMLEALDLQPGMRVLEIGGGTGYNAALIAELTGTEVTTVEAGERAATHAAAALAELGFTPRVRLEHADGYPGDPAGHRYDRIVVTCGIAGIPPQWLNQLTDNGMFLAPIAHAVRHPLITLASTNNRLVGHVQQPADFMPAAGALRSEGLFPHDPMNRLPARDLQHHPAQAPPLDDEQYRDLTVYLGARRANHPRRAGPRFLLRGDRDHCPRRAGQRRLVPAGRRHHPHWTSSYRHRPAQQTDRTDEGLERGRPTPGVPLAGRVRRPGVPRPTVAQATAVALAVT